MGRMGRARPHCLGRRAVGWGGVKYFKSNAKVSLSHSHPPSHIIRNTKENQLLLRRLFRIGVYTYANISSHLPIYRPIFNMFSNRFRFLYLVLIFVAICSYMFHNIVSYCLIYVPICFDISAIYSYEFSNIFK